MQLYKINEEIEKLMDSLESYEWDEAQDPVWQLEALQMQYNDKVLNICQYVRNLETDIDAIDAEIARLTALKKNKTNKVASLEEYLRFSMQQSWVNELDLGIFKVKLSPSYAMKVEDLGLIPLDFIKSSFTLDSNMTKDFEKVVSSLSSLWIDTNVERKVMLTEVKKWYQELDPAQREKLQDKVFLQTNYNLKIK